MNCLNAIKGLEGLIEGQVYVQEPMSKHTTWKVGGPAEIMVIPQDVSDVGKVVCYATENALPWQIIGNGSNLLVLDKGIKGIVIKINNCIDNVQVKDDIIIAGAGVLLPKVARIAISNGLKGLEFAVGIPATVGGAVVMNAGAHGSEISQVIREVKVVDPKGNILRIPVEDLRYSYRSSCIKKDDYIVVEATFKLGKGEASEIKEKAAGYIAARNARQPLNHPNAGSVFRNLPGLSAGKLIEEAGCKGMQVGQAKVSDKHANFIVNLGAAKAEDITQLISQIRQRVFTLNNISLELEVQILGES